MKPNPEKIQVIPDMTILQAVKKAVVSDREVG